MANSKGFWSYVHADDEAEHGRISGLARDVKDQYEMLTGEEISLFLDIDELRWGEIWRDKIYSNLASVAFFIPVLTPRYFMSPECRRELQFFAGHATELGIKELILPLYYVNVPAIEDKTTADGLIELVCTFQREDWRNLRFLDVTSERYRRGAAKLADRLFEANRRADRRAEETTAAISSQVVEVPKGKIDEVPGVLDKLASAEEKLRKWPDTLKATTQNVELIAKIMQESTNDINKANSQGAGFAARLIVVRRMALQLEEPTKNIWSLSNEFVSQVHSVDEGFRIIIERAPAEINDNPDAKANFCNFFDKVRELTASSHSALESTQVMIDTIEPLERMSRDLRPVLRRLRQGLTIMVESREVIDEWVHLIESSGVVGEGADAQTSRSDP